MKYLLLLLLFISLQCYGQLPRKISTLTITEEIKYEKTKSSHGFAVGDWLTIDGTGAIVKGSDPSTQAFIGVVSAVPTSNTYNFASPGESIVLSGLTAGSTYYAQSDGTTSTASSPKPVYIATSTTTAILLSGSFGVTLPPPSSQSSGLAASSITSTTASLTCVRGNGGFVMFLLSESPISTFPQNNQTYNPDANFPDGDELSGSGVFVMYTGTENTVAITGLDAATLYYALALEYDAQGLITSYNTTTGTNTTSFTTLADATTPTTQFITTSVRSEEDRIRIQGTRGNGDNIVVIASTEGQPDTDIADGVNPTAGAYGAGTAVGNGYVVYEGSAHDFHITGFDRDRMVWWKIMEREDTGFLYNTISTIDSAWAAYAYDSLFSGSSASDGQTYLEASSLVFYDPTRSTGTDGSNLSNGNAGLEDYSANANTATIVNTPTVEDLTISPYSTKSWGVTGNNVITTGHDGTSWFTADFRLSIAFWIADGQPASGNQYLFGVQSTGGTHICSAWIASASNNEINIRYRSPTADSRWDSNNTALLADGPGFYVLEIEYDFTNDQIEVVLNGSAVTGAFASGSMAALNPADFNPDVNFSIGSANVGGTIQSNGTAMQISRFTVTGIPTSQQITDIRSYFNFIPTVSGSGYDRWTAFETVGFTHETLNDSLHLSGNPAGYQDYMRLEEIFVDTLEEWRMGYIVKINDALTTSTIGTGIGVQNDIAAEANRGVRVLFVTDTDSPNFGRIQLYSGTGAVGPTNFSLRTQSSGAFVPAEDSVYHLYLTRTWLNNDALYVATLYDPSTFASGDSLFLTTSWSEPNRTSTEFYSTTTKAIIWHNGGDFMINPFQIVRVGLNSSVGGSPPPPPTETSIDVFVTKTGSDANACTESLPCLTVNRGLARGVEIGGSFDMSVGAGTYIEDFLVIPTTLDSLVGAGVGSTVIKGSPATYISTAASGRSGDNGALMDMRSASTTDVTTYITGITFEGNKDVGLNTNSTRHCFVINERDGVILDDIEIKYFNTTGLKLANVDDFTMKNFYMRSSSGEASSFTYYQIQTTNIGTNTVSVDTTDYRIVFQDGLIEAPESTFEGDAWSEGGGWGITGGGSTDLTKYICNVDWNNVQFIINKHGISDFNGHRFNMEGLYHSLGNVLIRNCHFNNNISFGGISDLDSNIGWTRITGNTFDLAPDNPTFVIEMQISNIEIDNNFIKGARNGVFISLNDQDTFGNAAFASITRGDHGNWDIHHNIIQCITSANYGMFGGANWELHNYQIRNNTIHFTTTQSVTSNPNWYAIFTDNNAGSVSTGLIYQNNVFLDVVPSPSQFWDGGGMSGGLHRYNKSGRATNLSGSTMDVTATRSGVTSSNNQNHTGTNGLGLGLGTFPTTWDQAFNGDYYRPQLGSVLIDAGFGSVTIGALEEN